MNGPLLCRSIFAATVGSKLPAPMAVPAVAALTRSTNGVELMRKGKVMGLKRS
jgi:hypothetical protein